MRIEKDFDFSKNSVAQIYSNGLIGGKVMKILPDYKGPELQAGDTLQSDIEMGVMANVVSRLGPLREKLESSMTGIDSLIVSVNNILNKDSQKRIQSSIASLDSVMGNFKNASREINGLMARNSSSIDHTISSFEKTAANLEQLSDSLSLVQVRPLVDKANTMLDDFNAISSKLNNGEGTAGKLLNDDEIYNNLDNATRQLEELVQDIKLNPRRYVNLKFSIFGGKKYAEPYQKPEDRSL